MNRVSIVTGIAGAGKTDCLLDRYSAALDAARSDRLPGCTLWLTPTRRVQKWVLQQIAKRQPTGCFAANVLTFDLFAQKILMAAGSPAKPVSSVMKRLLLRRITAQMNESNQLQHFRSIADTTGFLDIVSSFISELKREEIWPEKFVEACRDRKSAFAQRDRELGQIYATYQHHLADQNWYDNEGRFWLARNALEQGQRTPFASVRMLAVDGFTDFTQTQYEILGHLASWIADVNISIPTETPVIRSELFSKPQIAIKRIRDHLPKSTQTDIQQPKATSQKPTKDSEQQQSAPSIRVISEKLFASPHNLEPSPHGQGFEIVAATGQQGEWQAIALRIKRLLANLILPNRPGDIVIGLRSISDDGPRLAAFLTEAGLPVWCEGELPFSSSPIVKAIQNVLQLELDDWPFDRLMSVLDSNYFHPKWPELRNGFAIRQLAACLRHLSIDSGRETILRVLERNQTDHENEPASDRHELGMFEQAFPLVRRLDRALEKLRTRHSLDGWADVLATIASDLQLLSASNDHPEELAAKESRDLELFQRILRTAAEADQKLGIDTSPKSLPEFLSELRDLLSHETLPAAAEIPGTIRILSVEQIRNLEIPHLFLMGMTENSFPMNRGEDCLFSESERQDLISRGVALRHRMGQHADEMSLFYSIVTRARRSLTVSYPAINTKGQPVFPSPYVTAITSLFEPGSYLHSSEGQLDPVSPTDQSLTATDLRLAAMSEARRGNPILYRSVLELDHLKQASLNTLAACDVANFRFHRPGFTAYEGQLNDEKNRELLLKRFGDKHQFSTTELEAYARCPFQFWLANVLKIHPVETPEESTDVIARGTLLHQIIATLQLENVLNDPEQLSKRFGELIDTLVLDWTAQTRLQRALIRIERQILREWAKAFSDQQFAYQQKIDEFLKETTCLPPEIPFGHLPDAPIANEDHYPAIEFGRGAHRVAVRGRIDRVDVGKFEGHPAYIVIDYKTGMRPTSTDQDLLSGRSIQLPLYVSAIRQLGLLGEKAIAFQMGYWALRDTGFKPGVGGSKFVRLDENLLHRMEAILDHLLPQLVDEIRSGRFVVENSDVNCTSHCAYRTVCRVNQLRAVAEPMRKISAPRIDPTANSDQDE